MQADYGQDAPGLLRGFLGAGVVLLVVGLMFIAIGPGWWRLLGKGAAVASLYPLGMAALMVHGSRVGKLRDRDRVLDGVDWRGVSSVVDLVCGRGLMTIGAVLRMTGGVATGVGTGAGTDVEFEAGARLFGTVLPPASHPANVTSPVARTSVYATF